MASDNFTVNQNTGYVEQATATMAAAQVDDIERRAKASVTTAKEESARAETAEKGLAGGKVASDPAAKVYGDMALDAIAPGLKMAGAAVDIISERHSDREGAKVAHDISGGRTQGISQNAISIEEDIASAARKPGAYRMPTEQRAFGDTPSKPGASIRTKATSGEDLMASANIATMSLKDQHKEAVGSWDVKEGSTKMAGVQLAKKLTFGQELSNEQALQSVYAARMQHSATIGMANQLSPGLSLSSGPSIRPQDLLKEARDDADMNRWRTQQ